MIIYWCKSIGTYEELIKQAFGKEDPLDQQLSRSSVKQDMWVDVCLCA